MKLIIYAHPQTTSHSHEALQRIIKKFQDNNTKHHVIDLYQENFNSALQDHELTAMKNKTALPSEIQKYQDLVTQADTLIFIYPVWWFNAPAILKGFIDRVFANGFAFRVRRLNFFLKAGGWLASWIPGIRYLLQPYSAKGGFKGKKAIIIRTYGGPKFGSRVFGHTVRHMENSSLRYCGITNIKKFELFSVNTSSNTPEKEEKFYQKIVNYL